MRSLACRFFVLSTIFIASGCDSPVDGMSENQGKEIFSSNHPEAWTDIECNRVEPDLDCIKRIFTPLAEMNNLVPRSLIENIEPGGTFVTDNWVLSTIHMVVGKSSFPTRPYEPIFYYRAAGSEPKSVPGLGEVSVIGGHPHTIKCEEEDIVIYKCVDQVPIEEAFDIAIVKIEKDVQRSFPIADTSPAVGDQVYIIGFPFLKWLSKDILTSLHGKYPLVSVGKIISNSGNSLVTDAAAFAGNSGGPLLNDRGEIVGVLYTLVGHVRNQGIKVPNKFQDWYSVAVKVDNNVKTVVNSISSEVIPLPLHLVP